MKKILIILITILLILSIIILIFSSKNKNQEAVVILPEMVVIVEETTNKIPNPLPYLFANLSNKEYNEFRDWVSKHKTDTKNSYHFYLCIDGTRIKTYYSVIDILDGEIDGSIVNISFNESRDQTLVLSNRYNNTTGYIANDFSFVFRPDFANQQAVIDYYLGDSLDNTLRCAEFVSLK